MHGPVSMVASDGAASSSGAQGTTGDIDYDALESYLSTLGFANRLQLLTQLREPRTIDEIRLTPAASQAGENPDRPITRQAVQNHLDKLINLGLVRTGTVKRPGKRTQNTYQTDHSRLFALIEEFRRLCQVPPPEEFEPFATTPLPEDGSSPDRDHDGPRLVLVHGVHVGRSYPLRRTELTGGRGWVIGRDPEVHVPLALDPFVSKENAEILATDGGGFELMDLRTAKNGTFLNWDRLPVGGREPLGSGDVIGVGRSLLVFKEG